MRLYCLNVMDFANRKRNGERVIGGLAVFEANESGDASPIAAFLRKSFDGTRRSVQPLPVPLPMEEPRAGWVGGYRQNHRRVPRGHVQAGPIAQIGFRLRCDETRLLLMSISS